MSGNAFEVVDRRSPLLQNDAGTTAPLSFSGPPHASGPDQLAGGAAYYPNVSHAIPMQPFPPDLRQRMSQSTLLGTFGVSSDYSSIVPAQPPLQPSQRVFPNVAIQPYPLYPPFGNYDQTQPLLFYGSGQHSPSYPPPLPGYPPHISAETQPQQSPPLEKTTNSASAGSGSALVATNTVPVDVKRAVVFGSIGLPGSSKGPSPAPRSGDSESKTIEGDNGVADKPEKVFSSFSIGVAPGEPGPSRVKASKMRRRTETAPGRIVSDAVIEVSKEEEVQKRVIDLTETKWAFGTIKSPVAIPVELRGGGEELVPSPLPAPLPAEVDGGVAATTLGDVGVSMVVPLAPLVNHVPSPRPLVHAGLPSLPHVQTGAMLAPVGSQLVSPINCLPMTAPFPVQRTTVPILSSASPTDGSVGGSGPEWEVKDFGYGFGNGGPSIAPDEREAEKERERERESQREREFTVRPRRGSYGGGYAGYDRGSFGGRRGRGGVNGGYNSGTRAYNGPRVGRGTYQAQQQSQQPAQRQPPFTITPPPQFSPLSPHADPAVAAYYASQQPLATYIPTGYEPLQPPAAVPAPLSGAPVPVPLSTLSFPLDPVRTYLLGQLEYYLSPQNMVQDFFLRQRVGLRVLVLLKWMSLIDTRCADGLAWMDPYFAHCVLQSRQVADD